jgi:hypothetical protein
MSPANTEHAAALDRLVAMKSRLTRMANPPDHDTSPDEPRAGSISWLGAPVRGDGRGHGADSGAVSVAIVARRERSEVHVYHSAMSDLEPVLSTSRGIIQRNEFRLPLST